MRLIKPVLLSCLLLIISTIASAQSDDANLPPPQTVTIAGTLQPQLGCSGEWQPDCLRSLLQDPDGDGIYTFVTALIPAGDYEAKVAINQSWDENYGTEAG